MNEKLLEELAGRMGDGERELQARVCGEKAISKRPGNWKCPHRGIVSIWSRNLTQRSLTSSQAAAWVSCDLTPQCTVPGSQPGSGFVMQNCPYLHGRDCITTQLMLTSHSYMLAHESCHPSHSRPAPSNTSYPCNEGSGMESARVNGPILLGKTFKSYYCI